MGFDCRSQCRFTLSNTHHQRRHKLKFHSCLIRQAQRAGGATNVKLQAWSRIKCSGVRIRLRFLRTDNCSRAKREGLTPEPLPGFTHDISGQAQPSRGPRLTWNGADLCVNRPEIGYKKEAADAWAGQVIVDSRQWEVNSAI